MKLNALAEVTPPTPGTCVVEHRITPPASADRPGSGMHAAPTLPTHAAPVPQVVGRRDAPAQGLPQMVLKGSSPLASDLLHRGAQGMATSIIHSPGPRRALNRLPVDARIGPELFGAAAGIPAQIINVDATGAHPTSDGGPHHG